MSKKKSPELPASREVRLQDGVTEGFAEHVGLKIYTGSTRQLLEGIVSIELTIEARRANAARTLAMLVRNKLIADGYLVETDIDHILEDFLEAEQNYDPA